MPAKIPLPFGPDAHTLNVDKSNPTTNVPHPEGAPNPKGVEVAQGFGGSGFSHNDTSSGGVFHYAVDFLLRFDEPVLSQGNGKVIALDESRPDGGSYSTDLSDSSMGPSGIGNFVTVKYDEGFYATYQHLKQDGVEVIKDATVKPHDVLGHVGNTGFRTATHLHVTYGEQTIDPAWQAGQLADGSSAKNHNTAPVLFAADSDGILDEDKYYHGDNIKPISGPVSDSGNVNLLQNGSFEEGTDPGVYLPLNPGSKDINGWEVIRGGIDYVGTDWVSSDGSNRSLDLNGTPGVGGVAQTFTTTPGQQYHVSFDLAGHYSGLLQTIGVSAAGQSTTFSFQAGANPKALGWEEKTWEFTATDAQTKLEFSSLQTEYPYGGPALDDVVVTASNASPVPSQPSPTSDIPFFTLGGQPPEMNASVASDDFLL